MNARPDIVEPLTERISWPDDPSFRAPATLDQQQVQIITQGREVLAKKVSVPRSMQRILQELQVWSARFGDRYVYSWEVNDNRNRRKQTIEGGTIKLAYDLLNLWGNCGADVDLIKETSTHWVFCAWFVDHEKGVATSRLFQQRKNQDTGMKDADRRMDMVFQVGQSKAIRNVVLNALRSIADEAIEMSRQVLLEKFQDEGNRARALAFIEKVRDRFGIEAKRVEAVVGRKQASWTVRDIARVFTEMRGIVDGMTDPDEVYPTSADADAVSEEKETKKAAEKKPAPAAEKKAAETKPAKAPAKAEPEPEPALDPETGEIAEDEGSAETDPDPEPEQEPEPEKKPAAGGDDDGGMLFGDDA